MDRSLEIHYAILLLSAKLVGFKTTFLKLIYYETDLVYSVLVTIDISWLRNQSPVVSVVTQGIDSGMILGLHPANERRRYKVTPSLIGWTQT